MELGSWIKIYFYIARKMGYNILADQITPLITQAIYLYKTISPKVLYNLIRGKNAFVFGAGPSLQSGVHEFNRRIYHKYRDEIVLISADAATHILVENGIRPDIIVTDLDGDPNALITSSQHGAIMVTHAHGDNLYQTLRLTRHFNMIIISTQVIPIPPIINYGGYTDGDRAVLLANECDAKKIFLVGMDFYGDIDRFKKHRSVPENIKRLKLLIGKEIIKLFVDEEKVFIVDGFELDKIYSISWDDVEELIIQ